MTTATHLLRGILVLSISLVLLRTNPAAVTQNVSGGTNVSACEREIKKLGPRRWGEKIRHPWKNRNAKPAYPPIPEGTTGGGVWIGEILIDTRGRVSDVWTIREVKVTPPVPSLNKAITDAVAKWEFAPAAIDDVPVPVCLTVTVNVNLKAIRGGQ
jgi:outer membrane biosynthesis protein TonB